MKRTYSPSKTKRRTKHGFLKRKLRNKKVLLNRMRQGRKRLCV